MHNGVLFNHNKKIKVSFLITWMDQNEMMRSKISQALKDMYYIISLIGGI